MNGKLRHAACFTNWCCCLSMMLAISGRVHDAQVHVLAFAHLSIKLTACDFCRADLLCYHKQVYMIPNLRRVSMLLLYCWHPWWASSCLIVSGTKQRVSIPRYCPLLLLQTSSCTHVLLLASTWTQNLAKVLRIAKQSIEWPAEQTCIVDCVKQDKISNRDRPCFFNI